MSVPQAGRIHAVEPAPTAIVMTETIEVLNEGCGQELSPRPVLDKTAGGCNVDAEQLVVSVNVETKVAF